MEASSVTYTVLARRYRPQGFDEVIGQEHVATSLRNAILSGRVGHAYLFTGARGVGKTSTARIFAKALNCPNAVDATPCNHCEACESIAVGSDVDVHEIDGASNNGVDNVRDLRANVTVTSMRSKYKIYIIDEVHMLSKPAFNALLKTLEEPPPNVKFVFCTTEPTKVPDTILSRCQRFDFGTIALPQIIERLADIAMLENMEVEPAALELVARRAAGSMRDSQSLFDQLLASADKRITAAEVHRLLGTASDERLIELFASIIGRQRSQTLSLFSQALSEGAQLGEFTDQILSYLRDLMVLAAEATNVPLLSVAETSHSLLLKQAQAWGLNTIVAALQIVSEAKLKMQRATFGRALVELALIRLTLLEQLQSLDALLTELASAPANRTLVVSSAPAGESEKKKPEPVTPEPTDESRRMGTPARPVEDSDAVQKSDVAEASEGTVRSAHQPVAETIPPPALSQNSAALEAVSPPSSGDFQPGSESAFWAQVLSEVSDDVGNALRKASRIAIRGPNRLEVEFPKSYLFAKSLAEQPEARQKLDSVVARLAGRPVQVVFGFSDEPAQNGDSVQVPKPTRRMDTSTDGDPYVERVIELFNAKVMKKESLARPSGQET
ncbi:DNA polymerase III, subunit gamma and tau [Planctomycetia bacterium]|nr:DNA polymerase III, subunit gamma and tau [Planctomycetia bacterium]